MSLLAGLALVLGAVGIYGVISHYVVRRSREYGIRIALGEQPLSRDVAIGAVYATLDRLEAKGLVASTRGGASEGPSRRVFAITPAGSRSLALTRATRERLWSGVKVRPLADT